MEIFQFGWFGWAHEIGHAKANNPIDGRESTSMDTMEQKLEQLFSFEYIFFPKFGKRIVRVIHSDYFWYAFIVPHTAMKHFYKITYYYWIKLVTIGIFDWIIFLNEVSGVSWNKIVDKRQFWFGSIYTEVVLNFNLKPIFHFVPSPIRHCMR